MSNSTADLPYPMTIRPLSVRANSPTLSTSSPGSSRGSHRQKNNSRNEQVEIIPINDSPSPRPSPQVELKTDPSEVTKVEDDSDDVMIIPDEEVPFVRKNKGKGKALEVFEPAEVDGNALPTLPQNLLSSYSCPICLSTVTNACLTPCGHVLCGLCLFSAVRSGIKRGLELGIPLGREGTTARCPVCRATLKDWDGKGGGVIPLKIRTITTL